MSKYSLNAISIWTRKSYTLNLEKKCGIISSWSRCHSHIHSSGNAITISWVCFHAYWSWSICLLLWISPNYCSSLCLIEWTWQWSRLRLRLHAWHSLHSLWSLWSLHPSISLTLLIRLHEWVISGWSSIHRWSLLFSSIRWSKSNTIRWYLLAGILLELNVFNLGIVCIAWCNWWCSTCGLDLEEASVSSWKILYWNILGRTDISQVNLWIVPTVVYLEWTYIFCICFIGVCARAIPRRVRNLWTYRGWAILTANSCWRGSSRRN